MILFLLFFILFNQILGKSPMFNAVLSLAVVLVYHFILGADAGIAHLFSRMLHAV